MCIGSSTVSAAAGGDERESVGQHHDVVNGVDGHVNHASLRAVDLDRDHVGSGRVQVSADRFVAGGHQDRRPVGSELIERVGQHQVVVACGIARRAVVAVGDLHDRQLTQREDHFAESSLANHREVNPDRGDRPAGSASSDGGCDHPPRGFGVLGQHSGKEGRLGGLLLEPALPGSLSGGVVDSTLGNPAGESG